MVNRAYPRVPVTETSQSSPATEENVGDLQSDIYSPPVTETSQSSLATEENVRDLRSDRCLPPFSILESFLGSQGIRIKVRPAEDAFDQVIDSLSLYLGEHYDALSSLHCKIKRAMQTGKSIIERAAIGSSIYWIEAKSGDYQHYVGKYSRFACQIGLDPEHSFLVLAQESDGRCDELSSQFSITVCSLWNFKEKLLSVVRYDIARRGAMGRRSITRSER